MKKRIVSLVLAVLMLCALLPHTALSALAANPSGTCGAKLTWSFDAKSGKLTIKGSGEMTNYGIEEIPPWADYIDQITSVALPAELLSVGNMAFMECDQLKSVVIPAKVKRIGVEAFAACEALKTIRLPDSLVEIGAGAFAGCTALEEITLPKKLKSVGALCFLECENLKRIVATSNTPYVYTWVDPFDFGMQQEPQEPVDLDQVKDSKESEEYLATFCLHNPEQVEVYGYSKGAEGEVRSEKRDVYDRKTGETTKQTVKWARSLASYAKTYKYKFYPLDKFVDVKAGDAFQVPVAWAVGNKVTAGMDATHFAPAQTVTRAQAMTFFWAAQHKPKFKKASTQFVDVKKTDWFYKSVMWAVEQGVTAGTDATHFSPNKTCNRGEILAFLYASLKKPKVKISNPYKDVSNQWYKKAALWAYANGIEKGDYGKFSASTPCTRASTVTYLYRFLTGYGLVE